ncbi:MAG TPA: PGPGW domain-containing protein [Solimonas sp.]
MITQIRASWNRLKRAPPGERFSRYHEHRQQQRRHAWLRPLWLIVGTLVIIIGVILMPAPGPGMLIVVAGAAIVAGESATVARLLDRGECWIRHRLKRR